VPEIFFHSRDFKGHPHTTHGYSMCFSRTRHGRSRGKWTWGTSSPGRKPKIRPSPTPSTGTSGKSRQKTVQRPGPDLLSGTGRKRCWPAVPSLRPRGKDLAGRESPRRQTRNRRRGTEYHFPFFHDCRQGMGNVGARESGFRDPEAETSAREGSEIEYRRDGKESCQYGPHLSHIVRFACPRNGHAPGRDQPRSLTESCYCDRPPKSKGLEVGAFVL